MGAGAGALRATLGAGMLVALLGAGAAGRGDGFGGRTHGGAGRSVVHVTNLLDDGRGSLREALAGGDRTVVFDVAGEITLATTLYVRGAYVTIDGTSAPAPGITLRGHGLAIHGHASTAFDCRATCFGAHDVVVRGVRVRGAAGDGLRIAHGAHDVRIERVSIQGSADGNLDITDSHDVTVAWSILAEPALDQKNMLIKYRARRVSLHHNLFVAAKQRNPLIRVDEAGTPAADTTVDMRNNVVWDWGPGYGTLVSHGPRANVVANLYGSVSSPRRNRQQALVVCDGLRASARCDLGRTASRAWVYAAGNLSVNPEAGDLNAEGTESTPFPAPPVATRDACAAARDVLEEAGVRPLDALDRAYVSRANGLRAACAARSRIP
jgi:hypothetical protein